ncbi:MAG TPA: choice-of-anchor tandem repeat GloVer-containing protein, partial [Bryobacteraceae bacterium]|nr:choice-of-anchor tandem repeat GloVer-containing protein [Bryobacteraceae bacterium]
TVFKITPEGALTTLHTFDGTDGSVPWGLVQAASGDFYGTTYLGGAYGQGTVFKVTPSGALTTLYSFCAQSGCPDGAGPYGGLAQSTDGALYGTTVTGGSNHVGTFFKVTTNGTLTTLYSFCSGACADGYYPYSGLVLASDGDFYGTTQRGGPDGYGTAFKITPGGTLTTLYRLGSQSGAGEYPVAALVQDTNGAFYGTTPYGAADNDGTVFGFSAGLRPFVKTLPHYGNVGTAITILGTDLTGTTSVSFNGTPAAFNIVSATEITTTVPAATTSGSVQVTTPGGVLLSGGPFLVVP